MKKHRVLGFGWSAVFAAALITAQALAGCTSNGQASKGFVLIPAGTFMMGNPDSNAGRESPSHSVTVSSFYMSRYEVTQKEYLEVMGENPSFFRGDNLLVESIVWALYCNKRSELEGLTPAYQGLWPNPEWDRSANGYRLPTEAEWEYACRAGTTTPFYTGKNYIPTSQAN